MLPNSLRTIVPAIFIAGLFISQTATATDLKITKSVEPTTIALGDTVTFMLTVTNSVFDVTAVNTHIVDVLPEGLEEVTASWTDGETAEDCALDINEDERTVVDCSVGKMQPAMLRERSVAASTCCINTTTSDVSMTRRILARSNRCDSLRPVKAHSTSDMCLITTAPFRVRCRKRRLPDRICSSGYLGAIHRSN